ncbi:serine/threonine-protein kinase [Nonomuraea longicatena]|uniref:serine/threonine-protein kinase n=1 Tax=Nonomuraea longicatena TaxID=83682 RepID=UPI0031D8DB12
MLENRIGAGGMGEVWRALDQRLDRRVAVKVVLGHHASEVRKVERLKSEAKIVAPLQHPGIVVVFDAGEHDGRLYIVMELLEGQDLSKIVTAHRGGMPIDRVTRITGRMAEALAAAHAGNVIHRDIKPANVMVSGMDRVKICDFGVARIIRSGCEQATSGIGTPAYMAPEQFGGRVDARVDLYSLGCVAYEMAVGERPFLGTDVELMYQHTTQMPKPPCSLRKEVPSALEDLILELMAKDPADRPQRAEDVVARLRSIRSPVPTLDRTPVKAIRSVRAESSGSFEKVARSRFESEPLRFPLGRDEAGTPVTIDLEESVHLLIGGSSGSGYTDPVQTIVAAAVARTTDLRLAILDSHAERLTRFADAAHVLPLAMDNVLPWAADELDRRYRDLRRAQCRTVDRFNSAVRQGLVEAPEGRLGDASDPHPPVIVVVDELADLLRAVPSSAETLRKIARVGRAAALHLVLRTSRPNEQVARSAITCYLPARLGLAMPTPEMSRRILDQEGAESLRLGEALYRAGGDAPVRFLRLVAEPDQAKPTMETR